jgi:hypothetical protein
MSQTKALIFLLLFTCCTSFGPASAHPGIGLVIDKKGNIYYTDLRQIWKQTPTGEKSIAVAGVHSHELYIDNDDNLFGEHLWYEPGTDKFYHYQWCLKNTGQLIRLTENIEAYTQPQSFSFVRDDNGNMYWYERSTTDSIYFIRKDEAGNKKKIASGIFNDIRWMFSTHKGEIYFLDLDDLYKITDQNNFQLIAKNLCTGTLWTMVFGKQHSVFGIWQDNVGNIYAAVTEDRCIKKITPDGEVTIVYRSEGSSPINGLFDSKGKLWVLEDDGIRQVELTTISKGWILFSNNSKLLYGIIGLVAVFISIKLLARRRKGRQVTH